MPLASINQDEGDKLLRMEERAAQARRQPRQGHFGGVSCDPALTRGPQESNRPVGSFVFLGPTGVGKTELARGLANFLFGSDNSLIRFDMSEYMEKHAVAS